MLRGIYTGTSRYAPLAQLAEQWTLNPLVLGSIPIEAELDATNLDHVLAQALSDCDAAGIRGAGVTPFVLDRIGQATDGKSVPANLALAQNNARVAVQVAVAICRLDH